MSHYDVPRVEETGFDPGVLEDLERGVIPKGWETAHTGPRRYYGYNATNRCCRDWMLLGWPEVDGKPKRFDTSRLTLDCPKCHQDLYFDLAHPDTVLIKEEHQPPAIVPGRIK